MGLELDLSDVALLEVLLEVIQNHIEGDLENARRGHPHLRLPVAVQLRDRDGLDAGHPGSCYGVDHLGSSILEVEVGHRGLHTDPLGRDLVGLAVEAEEPVPMGGLGGGGVGGLLGSLAEALQDALGKDGLGHGLGLVAGHASFL